jgi:hypothetical protein
MASLRIACSTFAVKTWAKVPTLRSQLEKFLIKSQWFSIRVLGLDSPSPIIVCLSQSGFVIKFCTNQNTDPNLRRIAPFLC